MVARIYLIRHGETHENKQHIIQGQLDTDLNETGFEQARSVRDRLQDVPLCAAFSSDSKRAADTARTILERHPGVQLQTFEALRERYMGELQGKRGNLYGVLPPSVEQPGHFRARLLKWWFEVLVPYIATTVEQDQETLEEPHAHIIITSHGASISFLLLALLNEKQYARGPGEDYSSSHKRIYNASISTIDVRTDGSGVLVKVGDASHLEKPALERNADVVQDEPNA
ncbi:phosphoglycerate mutase-like protein [Exidia glandulosa HHB12029]|uniref:Phosphoglycerate mutase-like protein n=1 Tax=Exidia glandulosa HHB12029 TaxID=1314781 RepID=A0A165KCV4_EXIGL|nr:phosphoglycerate mutase-like protein [Exidia glandulosa HHB12029]